MPNTPATLEDTPTVIIGAIKKLLYRIGIQRRMSARRLKIIEQLSGVPFMTPAPAAGAAPLRILDVGCANGKDFITFLAGRDDLQMVGIDITDKGLEQDNVEFILGDAERLDFPDKHFDLTVSVGVLEHIVPIEKLSRMISEIERVSKAYVIIVPAMGTLVEPHVASLLWPARDRHRKPGIHYPLIYFSDEAWLAFEGFAHADTRRFWHLPGLIRNLAIYRSAR